VYSDNKWDLYIIILTVFQRSKTMFAVHAISNWNDSTVATADLREWLSSKGLHPEFFFPDATCAADYLDPNNPRYAFKLAAAVRAWQAVTDPGGKHPKQALIKWLRGHWFSSVIITTH